MNFRVPRSCARDKFASKKSLSFFEEYVSAFHYFKIPGVYFAEARLVFL